MAPPELSPVMAAGGMGTLGPMGPQLALSKATPINAQMAILRRIISSHKIQH
jgi:hypothetical protein